MSVDTIIFIVVVILFVFGGALKKLLERVAQQVQADREGGEAFQASPEEIEKFLRGLGVRGEPPAPEGHPPAAAEPQRAFGPAEAAEPPPAQLRQARQPPAPAGRRAPARRLAVPRPRRQAEPEAEDLRARLTAAERVGRPPAPAPPPVAVPSGARPPRGADLRQAVIWAEILGTPVGLRRLRRRPPAQSK
ncbi:MAG: hypothetical protein ACYS8K_04830 [Planctomycetota bacterium]|jgi:hypothetical protein